MDLDTILNKYCHLKPVVDYYFFLQPPIDVVVDRAYKRNSKEANDSISHVQRMHIAYGAMYEFLSAKMNRSIIDMVEQTDGKIRPSLIIRHKFVLLDKWNRNFSDEENHKEYRDKILELLELK